MIMERVGELFRVIVGLTFVLLQLHGAHGRRLGSMIQGQLPPCGPGGVPGFDCYDPPNHPLPPCDFKHQRIGFDCSGWPPANPVNAASPALYKSTPGHVASAAAFKSSTGHVQAELPPCSPGLVPYFDCYDPPPLPPCNIRHFRIGFDCSGWPPLNRVGTASSAALKSKGEEEQKTGLAGDDLPPCSSVIGGIPGWDCLPLPLCDLKHQRIGLDCSGWPPAGSRSRDHHG